MYIHLNKQTVAITHQCSQNENANEHGNWQPYVLTVIRMQYVRFRTNGRLRLKKLHRFQGMYKEITTTTKQKVLKNLSAPKCCQTSREIGGNPSTAMFSFSSHLWLRAGIFNCKQRSIY